MLASSENVFEDPSDLQDRPMAYSNNSASTITLMVGPDRRQYKADQDLICRRCPFFFNAFTGDFVESQTKTITLPDDDCQHIEDLLEWLEHDLTYVKRRPTWIWLAKFWLFADKYHIDDLQNEIMDTIYEKFVAHHEGINISFETLDYIAENTFSRSPLRRIFTDILTNGIPLQQLPSRVESIPHEFLQDMCIALKTTIFGNAPTNISLLTNHISTYYTSSASCKATAMPKPVDPAETPTELYCDGPNCQQKDQPIRDTMHICTNHNIKLCDECRHRFREHGKSTISLTSAPYRDEVTGVSTVIDGYQQDSGFYCDGPLCDPENQKTTYQRWALMAGDRYHCLECRNLDFCSICIRGPLGCKDDGHPMLRIRPTRAKKVALTEDINIKLRQGRLERGVCWRCESDEHSTDQCEAKQPVLGNDVACED